jgi:hypothetical protein
MFHIRCIFPGLLRLPLTVSKKHVENQQTPLFTFYSQTGGKSHTPKTPLEARPAQGQQNCCRLPR